MTSQIKVSVLVVCRNEERHIQTCIRSIEEQFSDGDKWELIIIDGASSDKTVLKAKEALKGKSFPYRILDNPGKTLARGWNIGIRNANGKYIIRPDAHAALGADYIKRGVRVLDEKGEVGAVGGSLKTVGKGFWGSINKEALSTPAGVGNSSFRINATSGYKDTAVYAVYRKEVFEQAGLFNEDLVRHQDTEFHNRVKGAGWKFWMDAEMKADYYCRDSYRGLMKQMFFIGYYLPDLRRVKTGSGIKLRHLIPFFFFAFLAALYGMSFYTEEILWLALGLTGFYLFVVLLATLKVVLKHMKPKYLLVFFVIISMHLCYAAGTFCGIIKLSNT